MNKENKDGKKDKELTLDQLEKIAGGGSSGSGSSSRSSSSNRFNSSTSSRVK